MAGPFDILSELFTSARTAQKMGLPTLQPGFTDYGPWGAGGGPLGAGPFPKSPLETGPLTPSAPAAAPQKPFNALLDPNRSGLFGTLGALMGNPTREEYNTERVGQARAAGLQALGNMVQNGVPPQKAILDFIKSPDGVQFVVNSTDPAGEIKQFLGLTTPDTTNLTRQTIMEGAPGEGAGGLGDDGTLAPGEDYLGKAKQLLAAGDLEGAKAATQMAEEARQQGAAELTDDIKEYEYYVQQQLAAGKTPKGIEDWQTDKIKAGVSTPAGLPIAPALIEQAVKLGNQATEQFAQVDEAKQFRELAKKTPSGWVQNMSLPFRQALYSMGIYAATEDLANQETLLAFQNQMALTLRNPESGFGLTGNTSNFDIQFLKAAVAGLDKTPAANQIVLMIFGGRLRRRATINDATANWISQTGKLPAGEEFRDYLNEIIEKEPLLTADETKEIMELRQQFRLPAIDMEKVKASANAVSEGGDELSVQDLLAGPLPGSPDVSNIPPTFAPDDPPEVRAEAWAMAHPEAATPQSPMPGGRPEAPVGALPRSEPMGTRVATRPEFPGGGMPAAVPIPRDRPRTPPPGARHQQPMIQAPEGLGDVYAEGKAIRGNQLKKELDKVGDGFITLEDLVKFFRGESAERPKRRTKVSPRGRQVNP